MDIMTLAELIRVYRTNNRIPLSRLAVDAGCTKAHLSDMERGLSCNPTIRTVHGLSVALDVPFPAVATSALKSALAAVS